MVKKYYLPLPEYLTIKNSEIHGLGLYATQKIEAGVNLGITHVKDSRPQFEGGYIRTPLGGFFNHSENPNCEVISDDEFIYIKTLIEIEPGVEITCFYTLYDPTK